MRFALTASSAIGPGHHIWVAWSNEDVDVDHPTVRASHPFVVARAERLVLLGRPVGDPRHPVISSLDTPHQAYHTLLAVLREHGRIVGPIDFAGVDDEGQPMTFVPMPEAEHFERR